MDKEGEWTRYINALALMDSVLEGGYTQRAQAEKKKRIQARRTTDFARIKALPPLDTIKAGVFCVSLSFI